MSVTRKAQRGEKQPFGKHKKGRKGHRQRRFERKHYAPCVECGGMGEPVTGDVVHPDAPHLWKLLFYRCKCGAYVGAHRKGGHPLGYPAGKQSRLARMAAHAAFDPLWTCGLFPSRDAAYEWLIRATGIAPMLCHISKMGAAQANRVTRLSLEYWERNAGEAQQAAKAKEGAKRSRELQAIDQFATKVALQTTTAKQNSAREISHGPDRGAGLSNMRATGDGASCAPLAGSSRSSGAKA
jgi:hypothetical protein